MDYLQHQKSLFFYSKNFFEHLLSGGKVILRETIILQIYVGRSQIYVGRSENVIELGMES